MEHKINLKSAVAYVFVAIIAMAVMSACDDEDVEDMNPRSHVMISGFVTGDSEE